MDEVIMTIYISRISLILFTTALFGFSVFSQEIKISENDLKAIISNATSASSLLARREKVVTEDFRDRALPVSDVMIFTGTFLPPDKSQTFFSHESRKDKSVYETITIGNDVFEKTKDVPWKRRTAEGLPEPPPPPMKAMVRAAVDDRVSVIKKSNILLDKSQTDFYEMERITTRISKNGSQTRNDVNRYWINKNGTLAKSQTDTFESNSPRLYRRTVVYAYDPKIKIKAPIK